MLDKKEEARVYFEPIIREIIKAEILLRNVTIDLGNYSLNGLIQKLNNSIRNRKSASIRKKRYEITRRLLGDYPIEILKQLVSNFSEENYVIRDAIPQYIGDIDWYSDSKLSFSLEGCIHEYLLVNYCSHPAIRLEIDNYSEDDSVEDISFQLRTEIELQNYDPFSKTVYFTGCHAINNADMDGTTFRGLDVSFAIDLRVVGLMDTFKNPEWVICLAEGLAFLDKLNYKMSALRIFASLDAVSELLYSAVEAAYCYSRIGFLHSDSGYVDKEKSDIVSQVIKDFQGERKRLLEEKLRPSLKQFGISIDKINEMLEVFSQAEKMRNHIAHGEECTVNEDDVIDLLHSFLSILTQVMFKKDLSEFIKYIT